MKGVFRMNKYDKQIYIFKEGTKDFMLKIKLYDNGLNASLCDGSPNSTPVGKLPIFSKIKELLKNYDFVQNPIPIVCGTSPVAYMFFRHEIPEGLPKKKTNFIVEDFKRDYDQMIKE